jgi:membrane dipeptidase
MATLISRTSMCGRDVRRADVDPAVGCITLPTLRQARVRWFFGTIFTEMGLEGPDRAHRYRDHDDLDGAERAGLLQVACYHRLEQEGVIRIIRERDDLEQATIDTPGVLLLMEGADPIRAPAEVAAWHERGVRMVGLSWALGSRYAGGNSDGGPLTALGHEILKALDAHRIIHDVSHLSDAAFDAVMSHATGQVVASHSNCRALLDDRQRHLRDDQIRAIAVRGGVIGLNLYGRFLALDRRATIDDCVAHIEHVVAVAGRRNVVALGSDMDGGFAPPQLPQELDHPAKLPALAEALSSRGWSDAEIDGFTHANWLRLLREALP